jgi:predicted FMN-binding regulatory protein PaiB
VMQYETRVRTHGYVPTYIYQCKHTVGEFRKTRHSRNVEVNEICDASFQGQITHEDMESGTREVSESRMCSGLDSRTLEVSES